VVNPPFYKRFSTRATVRALILAMLVLLCLAIGGVKPWTYSVSAIVFAVALALFARHASRTGTRLGLDGFAIVLLGLVLASLVQCIPLPSALLKLLSPTGHEVYGNAVSFVSGGSASESWFPISLNISATLGK